jgi:hypothetical protein
MLAANGLALATCCAPAGVSSPAGKTARQAGPAIEISADLWDFGTLERGGRATGEITVTNTGSDTLRIALHSACDCLTASIASATIPPGGSSSVALAYLGHEVREASSKTLFIDSNDPRRERLTVTATGRVVEGRAPHLVALPNPLPIGKAASGRSHLAVSNPGGGDLVIEEVRCFGCVADWAGKVLRQGEEATIYVEVLPEWPDTRWVEIQSNDPISPLKTVPIVQMD